MIKSETLTPPADDSASEYDIQASNKKINSANQEIEEGFEKQMVGGSPASANLIVSCIIRQPMETVGVKYSKQASVGGFDPVRELMSSQIISTARTSKSNARDNHSRCGTSNSVGPVNNKHGLLNKSSFGLDITK